MSDQGLSAIVARHIAQARLDDIPESARHAAERSLLDAIGVSIAATGLDPVSRSIADLALADEGVPQSTVFGSRRRIPAAAAAFANGAYAHAIDFEDVIDGLPIHPNAQVVPAVLALAEARDLSGADVVRAIAVGCDLAGRLAAAVGGEMAARGWYPPPILGGLGAVAGAANLIGLDERRVLDALSLGLMQITASGEIAVSPRSTIRGIRDGFAAHAAVRSVQLAEAGIRGFDDPIGGISGFFAMFAGGAADRAALLDGLGEHYLGSEVAFKPWPSCRGTHAFVESILRLRSQAALDDIESIEIDGPLFVRTLAEPRAAKVAPTVPIDAKFSVLFTVAAALVDGAVTLDTFRPDALRRPELHAWADRVHVGVAEEFEAIGDTSGGRTELRLRDGRVLTDVVARPHGNPASPITDDELVEKFVDCVRSGDPALDRAAAERLAATLLTFRTAASTRVVLEQSVSGARRDEESWTVPSS